MRDRILGTVLVILLLVSLYLAITTPKTSSEEEVQYISATEEYYH